jgi:hypothetical protein
MPVLHGRLFGRFAVVRADLGSVRAFAGGLVDTEDLGELADQPP